MFTFFQCFTFFLFTISCFQNPFFHLLFLFSFAFTLYLFFYFTSITYIGNIQNWSMLWNKPRFVLLLFTTGKHNTVPGRVKVCNTQARKQQCTNSNCWVRSWSSGDSELSNMADDGAMHHCECCKICNITLQNESTWSFARIMCELVQATCSSFAFCLFSQQPNIWLNTLSSGTSSIDISST